MNYDCIIKQPMQMVELNLNMIISENPRLRNALDRSIDHPSIRNYINIPFIIHKFVLNITDEYSSFTNSTNNDNEDVNIIGKYLLLIIPSSVFLLSVFSLIVWTRIKPLING